MKSKEKMRIKSRFHLRKKELKRILEDVEMFHLEFKNEKVEMVEFHDGTKIVKVEDEPILMEINSRYFFTVFGALKYRPDAKNVVVDEGAVRFIMNGADVMKPGIVRVDEDIEKEDLVIVTEEKKNTPIAIGVALVDGPEMKSGKGKAVKNIHHVGDKIWNFFLST